MLKSRLKYRIFADMVELADTSDLGSGAERRKSSSLFIRTNSTV